MGAVSLDCPPPCNSTDFLYRFAVKVMDVNETLDLQQKVARLQALLEVSRRIHATIQLDEVLRVALEIVVREL